MQTKTIAVFILLFCSVCAGQSQPATEAPAPIPVDSLGNHHIMLIAPNGKDPIWIAVTPAGGLEFVALADAQRKMSDGYRSYTFGELKAALEESLRQRTELSAEVARLRGNQPETAQQQTRMATEAELQARYAQQQALSRQQADAQRRQLLMMYFLGMQPKKYDITVCDRTRAYCP